MQALRVDIKRAIAEALPQGGEKGRLFRNRRRARLFRDLRNLIEAQFHMSLPARCPDLAATEPSLYRARVTMKRFG